MLFIDIMNMCMPLQVAVYGGTSTRPPLERWFIAVWIGGKGDNAADEIMKYLSVTL